MTKVSQFLAGKEPVLTLAGDSRKTLKGVPDESVDCCVTSPPYWGLRRYGGGKAEIGQEKTPEEYVANLLKVFRQVWRVLKPTGTLWLNLGDSYVSTAPGTMGAPLRQQGILKAVRDVTGNARRRMRPNVPPGSKPKDLVGIPWLVAFALRADGWYLRQWIPWVKRNGMPESVDDRPSSSCEIVFLLSKTADYFYDHEAVKLPASMSFINDGRWQTGSTTENVKDGYEESKAQNPKSLHRMFDKQRGHSRKHAGFNERWDQMEKSEHCSGWRSTRNSDWFFEGLLSNEVGPLAFVVSPAAYKEAHFATWPPGLVRPMILASCPVGGIALDPFAGSGTSGEVAIELGRRALLCELNPSYLPLIQQRTNTTMGLPL